MVLVCVSHYLLSLSENVPAIAFPHLLLDATMVATPTFMLISGVTFGYLHTRSGAALTRVRAKLVDRALFLVTVVHVLVGLPIALKVGSLAGGLLVVEITDTIALSMLINLVLIRVLTPEARLWVAAGVFSGAWVLNLFWIPEGPVGGAVRDLLFDGAWDADRTLPGFALLPWMAVHLAATVLGERVATATDAGARNRVLMRVAGFGFTAMFAGSMGRLIYGRMVTEFDLASSSPLATAISRLVSPTMKYPPSPAYLAFFGGAALLLFTLIMGVPKERPALARVSGAFAVLGRASLFVWVVQAWIYWGLMHYLTTFTAVLWVGFLPVSLLVIWWAAWLWDRNDLNRFLAFSVGARFKRAKSPALYADGPGRHPRRRGRVRG